MNLDRRHPLADWPNEDLKQVSFKPREEILKELSILWHLK